MAAITLAGMPAADVAAGGAYLERALELNRDAQGRVRLVRDVPYGDHPRQRLDVYLPRERVSAPLPVLLLVHGGRWEVGDKAVMGAMAPALTAHPALLVTPNFRLAPEVRMEAIVSDVAAAVAWTHANIAAHGGDPRRLFIGGHSSGAHLAALVTLCKDFTAAQGLPPNVLKGCFPLCGTYSLEFADASPGSEAAAILDTVLERRADAPRYSPLRFVEGNRTPIHLTWGERDFPRVMDTGERLARALEAQPGRATHRVCPGLGHFEVVLEAGQPGSEWMRTVRAWMQDASAEGGETP